MRDSGEDVDYAAEMAQGATDRELIELARPDNRLLLTDDKDFGELIVRRGWPLPGLVLMRVASEQPDQRWQRLAAAIEHFGESLYGRSVVIEDARFRTRPMRGSGNA